MTWTATHRRDEVLRAVVAETGQRRDGVLPLELPGVAETFGGAFELVTALQLRWHTRLAGHVERALSELPSDLEAAVVGAWRDAATEMPGVRLVLDAQASEPADRATAEALAVARDKDAALLAAIARVAPGAGAGAVRAGERIERRARDGFDPGAAPRHRQQDATGRPGSLLGRLRAHLAA
ncbi:MAG: hypothetical protein QOC93_310 [Actinomycetota bacterium]|nr:hypothetical protein [Actinomycetota bacterium]